MKNPFLTMADVVTIGKGSEMMSRIRGKDTAIEIKIRKGLFNAGFRYRLHNRLLAGKPDLTFAKYKAVVFINGCFWHFHDCYLFKLPETRTAFWISKLESNRDRDQKNIQILLNGGWRVLVVWECSIRGKYRKDLNYIVEVITDWLKSDTNFLVLKGEHE